ncbi:hypothetical protein [Phenylobacterium sp.]|uniref:hypothetical protein n=1 Tax=Phenylobacterium sp. TaxID=1871053 RepID=UPI00391A91FA
MRGLPVLAAVAIVAAAPPAAAQVRDLGPGAGSYRQGLPSVNTPAAKPDPQAGNRGAAADFAAWNAKAGRPSILVFWNRELLEDATSLYDSVTTTRVDGAAEKGAFVARGRGVVVGGAASSASVAAETRSYQERSTDSRYGFRDGLFSKAVEASLMGTLLNAGARVMDREALIRKVGAARSQEARLDVQHLETLALEQGVKYLVEVLPDDDAASATGVSFTVKVTHLPTSTVRAQFVTRGDPPAGPSRLVAVSDGFERRADQPERTPEAIGAQVAYEVMGRLR